MNKSILALGIECSCDDTAIGLVRLSYNSQEKKIQKLEILKFLKDPLCDL